jgi:hypothetical protein
MSNEQDALQKEIDATVPQAFRELLERRDGAAQLVVALPQRLKPSDVSAPGTAQRIWELCGLYYHRQGRWHEAVAIFHSLYDQMLRHQEEAQSYVHKGMPLVWLSDFYSALQCPVLAKRYLLAFLVLDW